MATIESGPQKPIFYFIPGSWHVPESMAPALQSLSELGYEWKCPQLPSTGSSPDVAQNGVLEDAAMVRAELDNLVQQGRDVVVAGHSYGGIVMTQASAGLGKREREAAGDGSGGGIVALVYIASFLLPVGSSLVDAFGGQLAPFIWEDKDTGLVHPILMPPYPSTNKDEKAPNMLFYHDLPPEQADHYRSLLQSHSAKAQRAPINQAGYLDIPTTYLFCDDDQALPLFIQKDMVEKTNAIIRDHHQKNGNAASSSADGGAPTIKEIHFSTSHSPFLSQPEKFARVMVDCVPA